MNEMRRLINLVESAQHEQLDEAPIDDFSKDPAGMPYDPHEPKVGRFLGATATGSIAPWFMDLGMAATIGASVGGGFLGMIFGLVLGTDPKAPPYYKVRKTSAKEIADAPVTTAIRKDLRVFMNQMLNNIPDSISKYSLEIKNVNAYANGNLGAPYEPENQHDINARTEVIAELLIDYLNKQNKAFDALAKKHNLKPIQLGAMAYILYGETIEQAFVKKLQSKISD
jgi:hypothetical protein